MAAAEWEYTRTDSFEAVKALGAEGWELVGVVPKGDGECFYLKRLAPSLQERMTKRQRGHVLGGEAR